MNLCVRRLSQWTRIKNRKLISLRGPGTTDFLQGLVTNDMRYFQQLDNGRQLPVVYSMMLDQRGRVIGDVLLYNLCPDLKKGKSDDLTLDVGSDDAENWHSSSPPCAVEHVMCECDASLVDRFIKIFKLYRLRRPIVIEDCSELFVVNCIFPKILDGATEPDLAELESDIGNIEFNDATGLMNADPRLRDLGYRVLTKKDAIRCPLIDMPGIKKVDTWKYHRHLKICGVGEGPVDFPVGECTPLESNADYLNGVSFHKGCYVGQELTARTHHTGVVRKRLLPIRLTPEEQAKNIDLSAGFCASAKIVDESGRYLGKFRSGLNQFGLALIRYEEALKIGTKLFIQCPPGQGIDPATIEITCHKPWWWSDLELKGFQPDAAAAD